MTCFKRFLFEPTGSIVVIKALSVALRGHPPSSEHPVVQTKKFRLVGILARTEFCEHAMKKFFSLQKIL
jgi:hypothetical protein